MPDDDDKVDAARRRLLKIAVYTPPAILGALALMSSSGSPQVVCDPDTCAPDFCAPTTSCGPNSCHPVLNPCGPQTNCNPHSCNPIG